MEPVSRFTTVKTRSNPDVDIGFIFDAGSDYPQFFDEKSMDMVRKYTYQDILDTAIALKKVKKTGLTNMASIKNVINVLNGLGYEKESNIITSIKDGKRFSIKFYHMMITMIED